MHIDTENLDSMSRVFACLINILLLQLLVCFCFCCSCFSSAPSDTIAPAISAAVAVAAVAANSTAIPYCTKSLTQTQKVQVNGVFS